MTDTVLPSSQPNAPRTATREQHMERDGAPHLLIISHDVVGSRMAGPGIRCWEMARVLAAQQPVTLIAPQPIDRRSPAFACGDYAWGDAASLAGWLHDADVVLANGFVLLSHPELARLDRPLALDLYDPVLLENLELFRAAPVGQRAAQHEADRSLLARELAAGDFLLCATERQRDLYLGALMLGGRIGPAQIDADPQLRGLIDVVPFGLPAEPPLKRRPALRGVVPGIGADDPLLLWTGGLWDWMDPLTLVEAMLQVAARHPDARLVFLAGQHPGNVQAMRMPQAARDHAAALGLLDRQIFFYEEWVPYEQRANFLLEADIAVSLHRDHLETTYAAVRSRFLDHLWAGLPSVVSAGDAAAELVRTHGLGAVVAPQDVGGVAQALCDLLDDRLRRANCATNARELARQFTWAQTLAPLARFCQHPAVTRPGGARAAEQRSQEEDTAMHDEQQQVIRKMEQNWQLGTPSRQGGLLSRIVERLALRALGPQLAQQREFNAATVKFVYSLLPQMNALMAQIVKLGEFDGELNDRLLRLTHTVQLLDDAVAEADRVQFDLAAQLATVQQRATSLQARVDGHE